MSLTTKPDPEVIESMKDEARTADASLVATRSDADADTKIHIVLTGDDYSADEEERIIHETYRNVVAFLAKHMNPLAVIFGGGPPEALPRDEQVSPSDDRIDRDPADAVAALDDAAFAVHVFIDDATERVEWTRDEGASFGGGMALDETDQDTMKEILDDLMEFSTGGRGLDDDGPSGSPLGGGPGGLPGL